VNYSDVNNIFGELTKEKVMTIFKEIAYTLYGLKLPFETSAKILVSLCVEKGIQPEDVESLLMVYEKYMLKDQFDRASQRYSMTIGKLNLNRFLPTGEFEVWLGQNLSLSQKVSNKRNRNMLIGSILGCCVQFLDTKDCYEILRLNRTIRQMVKERILKVWVFKRNFTKENKCKLWKMFINTDEFFTKKLLEATVDPSE
jgi:hypothetical protein